MSEYETASMDEDKEDKIYLKVSLSKYPFLKNIKNGDKGEINYKGEITSSETVDGESEHQITFSDLNNKRTNVRV